MACLYEPDVRSYIANFDFVLLVETFSNTFPSLLFPLYDVFLVPGVKLTDANTARLSGGVALLVRKELSRFVDRIHTEYDNVIILKLSKELLGTESEVVLLGSYTPPANSVYYKETEITNGISLTEQCIMDVIETVGDLPLTVFGDLNARTGSENATETTYDDETFNMFAPNDESGLDKSTMRVSKDKEINEFGKYLLNMCAQFNLTIMNGTLGDECGKFTYISTSGCSVIDYFIASRQLLHMPISLHVAEKIESKHMPVELFIGIKNVRSKQPKNTTKTIKAEKYIWCDNKSDDFTACLRSDQTKMCFSEAEELPC